MSAHPPPDPVDLIRPDVQRVLDAFLGRQRGRLADIADELAPIVDAASELVRGGKRLRPAFCYWGWRATGRPDAAAVITVGAALELFHAAALVHDDLIDGADTRRGSLSAHRRFERLHTDARWGGDAAAFGRASAVLLGDLLLGWSDELFLTADLPVGSMRRGRPVFDRMRTEVGAGQFLDVVEQVSGTNRRTGQADRARVVIRYKSARYSVQLPMLLGGELADAPDGLLAGYSAYGSALGEAFQLRDDILGVFGDPTVTGKPAGDDLREGKRTVLVAYAMENATPAQVDLIERLLGYPDLGEDGVNAIRDVIVETHALDRVEEQVQKQVRAATRALSDMDVTDEARAALTALITISTTRSL